MKPNIYLLDDDFKELERILRDGTTPQDWEYTKMLYFFINTKIQNSRFSPEPYQLTAQQEHILETYRQKKKDEHPVIDKKAPLPLLSKVLLISFVAIFLIGAVIAYIAYTRITPDEKVIAEAKKALKALPDSSKFGVLSVDTLQKIKKELTAQINSYKEKPTEEHKEKLKEKIKYINSIYHIKIPPFFLASFQRYYYYQGLQQNVSLIAFMEDNCRLDLKEIKEIYIDYLETLYNGEEIQFSYSIFNKDIPITKYKIIKENREIIEITKDYQAGDYIIEIYGNTHKKHFLVKKINFTLY